MTTFNLSALNSSMQTYSNVPPSRARTEPACSDAFIDTDKTEPEECFSIGIPHIYENCMQRYVKAIQNYCCNFVSLGNNQRRRITSSAPDHYYLAFNEYGHLIALSNIKRDMQLKDSHGVWHDIQTTDWKASFPVYVHYVHFAVLDGKYPINPHISLKELNSPNAAQIRTINELSETINRSLQELARKENLDTLVENSLRNHFVSEQKTIKLVREEEAPAANRSVREGKITPEAKAYFVFFREEGKEYKVLSDPGIFLEEYAASPSRA